MPWSSAERSEAEDHGIESHSPQCRQLPVARFSFLAAAASPIRRPGRDTSGNSNLLLPQDVSPAGATIEPAPSEI